MHRIHCTLVPHEHQGGDEWGPILSAGSHEQQSCRQGSEEVASLRQMAPNRLRQVALRSLTCRVLELNATQLR